MKLKSLVAVVALACAPAAFAAANLGTLSAAATSIVTTGAFAYADYTFAIASSSSTLTGTFGGSFFSWGGSASLYNSAGKLLSFDSTPSSISFSGLSSGTYKLAFSGYSPSPWDTTIRGSLSATSSVAAPVPEANNYAMLALGLSGIGLVGLRRRRS